MKPLETQMDVQKEWDYCVNEVSSKQDLVDVKANVKNSQFAMPYFEFSGACSGCGETPLREAYLPALRRSRDGGQRYRLLVDLLGLCAFDSLYCQQAGARSGMGQLALRGLRRVWPRHVYRQRAAPPSPDRDDEGRNRMPVVQPGDP